MAVCVCLSQPIHYAVIVLLSRMQIRYETEQLNREYKKGSAYATPESVMECHGVSGVAGRRVVAGVAGCILI